MAARASADVSTVLGADPTGAAIDHGGTIAFTARRESVPPPSRSRVSERSLLAKFPEGS